MVPLLDSLLSVLHTERRRHGQGKTPRRRRFTAAFRRRTLRAPDMVPAIPARTTPSEPGVGRHGELPLLTHLGKRSQTHEGVHRSAPRGCRGRTAPDQSVEAGEGEEAIYAQLGTSASNPEHWAHSTRRGNELDQPARGVAAVKRDGRPSAPRRSRPRSTAARPVSSTSTEERISPAWRSPTSSGAVLPSTETAHDVTVL